MLPESLKEPEGQLVYKGNMTVPTAGTPSVESSIRFMRIFQGVLLIATLLYAYVAAAVLKPSNVAPPIIVEAMQAQPIGLIVVALIVRRRMLSPALEILRTAPADAKALNRWRAANVVSLIFAEAVAVVGVAVRALGGSGWTVWSFFVGAIVLMLLWTPRLDEGIVATAK